MSVLTSSCSADASAIAEALVRQPTWSRGSLHVPSEAVAALDDSWGAALLGDMAHAMTFDNSKVRSLVPGWAATLPF